MKVAAHPEYERLRATLAERIDAITEPCHRFLYRFSKSEFAESAEFLSGRGTLIWGTRFGAAGTYPILYGSTSHQLALEEVFDEYRKYGIQTPPLDHVVRSFECCPPTTLNLCSENVLKVLDLPSSVIVAEDWREDRDSGREALTQAVGRAARANGVQALVVPSRLSATDRNVAIFCDTLGRGTFIRLVSDHSI